LAPIQDELKGDLQSDEVVQVGDNSS
jgi:hypothetical protein